MTDTFDNARDNAAPPAPKEGGGWLQKILPRKLASRGEAQDPLPTTPAGIAKEIITDIALCQLKGVLPEGTKFTSLASLRNEEKGARAFAYKSTDDKNEVRIIFPGRSSGIKGIGTKPENATLAAVARGWPSYQVPVVEQWMQETVIPMLKKHPDSKVKIFGHSMGAGNAIAAKHLLDKNGITSETMIVEPFAATQAARFILEKDLEATSARVTTALAKAAIDDVSPTDAVLSAAVDEAKAEMVKRLQSGITSIRSYPNTMAARHPVGTSLSNNKQFGEKAFFLTASPQRPSQEGMSRRDVLAIPAKAITVPKKMLSKGTLEDDEFNQAGHTLQSCKKVLEAFGDRAIQPARSSVLSTPEHIIHPERSPVPGAAIFVENVAAGYYKALRGR